MGGKTSAEDKKTILATVKETTGWIDENGASATSEDLDEKLAGALSFASLTSASQRYKLSSTLLSSGGSSYDDDDDEPLRDHDELQLVLIHMVA